MRLPASRSYYVEMIELYSYFFDIETSNGELETLKDLSEYSHDTVGIQISTEDVGSLLAYLIDKGLMDNGNRDMSSRFSKIASQALYQCLGDELHADAKSSAKILDIFAYPPGQPLLGYKRNFNSDPCSVGTTEQTLEIICGNESKTQECRDYCRQGEIGLSYETSIRRLLNMSMDGAGPLLPGNPRSLLPVCRFPEKNQISQGCWQQIVTDRGLCYSSQTGTNALLTLLGLFQFQN